jgi:hypothetical protein
MYKFLLIAFILFNASSIQAQISDQIKKESKKNSDTRTNTPPSSSSSSGSSSSSNDGGSSCGTDLCGCLLQSIFSSKSNSNGSSSSNPPTSSPSTSPNLNSTSTSRRRDTAKRLGDMSSSNSNLGTQPIRKHWVDIAASGGFLPTNQYPLTLEVAYTGSAFSPSLRVYSLLDQRPSGLDHITYYDIQALRFCLGKSEAPVRFFIGMGALVEEFSGTSYLDFSLRTEFKIGNRLRLKTEGRLASDAQTDIAVRQELNAGMYYLVNPGKKTELLAGIHGSTQRFYEAVSVNSFGLGIWLRL